MPGGPKPLVQETNTSEGSAQFGFAGCGRRVAPAIDVDQVSRLGQVLAPARAPDAPPRSTVEAECLSHQLTLRAVLLGGDGLRQLAHLGWE